MDVTDLCNLVKQNPDDIMTEVMFQDWFGVSPSYELTLLETKREEAFRMMNHSGLFHEWQVSVGSQFLCENFIVDGIRHYMRVLILNHHQPYRYHVTLTTSREVKYNKIGNNLVELLLGVLKVAG